MYQTVEQMQSVAENLQVQESGRPTAVSVTETSSTALEQQQLAVHTETLSASSAPATYNDIAEDAPVVELADSVSTGYDTSSTLSVASADLSVVESTNSVSTTYDFLPTMVVTFTDISVIDSIAGASTKDDFVSTAPVASEPHLTAQFVDATRTPAVTATLKTVPGGWNSTTSSRPALANDALQATYGGGIVIFVFSLLFLL